MSVEDLYSEIILEHYKHPHNVGEIDSPDIFAKGYNESCGDDINVYASVKDGIVKDIKFVGKGCAISQSSASMMTDTLRGKTISEVREIIEQFNKRITGEEEFPNNDEWFELSALKGVVRFPVRVKCASLAWQTVKQGVQEYENKK